MLETLEEKGCSRVQFKNSPVGMNSGDRSSSQYEFGKAGIMEDSEEGPCNSFSNSLSNFCLYLGAYVGPRVLRLSINSIILLSYRASKSGHMVPKFLAWPSL